jgi:hypothetical protein
MEGLPTPSPSPVRTPDLGPFPPSPLYPPSYYEKLKAKPSTGKRCPKGTRKNKKTGECEKSIAKTNNKSSSQKMSSTLEINKIKVNIIVADRDDYAIENIEFKGKNGIDIVFDWSGDSSDKIMFVRKNGVAPEDLELKPPKNANEFLRKKGIPLLPKTIDRSLLEIQADSPNYDPENADDNMRQGIYGMVIKGYYNDRLDETDEKNVDTVMKGVNTFMSVVL